MVRRINAAFVLANSPAASFTERKALLAKSDKVFEICLFSDKTKKYITGMRLSIHLIEFRCFSLGY